MYKDIEAFHKKFHLQETTGKPHLLPPSLMQFRFDFMKEELDEINEAYIARDLAGVADGLIDLVYVVMGTAYMMGLPWKRLWDAVHSANMKKVRVEKATDSKRGSTYDVVKPEGWLPPDIEGILTNYKGRQYCATCRNIKWVGDAVGYEIYKCLTFDHNIHELDDARARTSTCWEKV